MEPGRGDDRIHHGVTHLDNDLHGNGHRWNYHLLEGRVRHRNGESAAYGDGELRNHLRWWDGDVDGNNRCFEPELRVESGWRDHGIDHGITGLNDHLYGHGDGWDNDVFEVRIRDIDGKPPANGDGEFGDDLRW